jgi:transcriptional regulator with PAS, ATPase and Fis domain
MRGAVATRRALPTLDRLLAAALEDVAGATLIADAKLRVVHATAEAERLLGCAAPTGSSVVKALCGDTERRPIADALAHGRPIDEVVERAGAEGAVRAVHVRATPIERDRQRLGWRIALAAAAPAAVEGREPAVLFHGMWTRDPAMKRAFHVIERAAARDVGVLIRGPTGSGKELVAHAIHALSPRAKGPFRAVNCAALPANLLESELFGHVKGAFTGAVRDSPGIFRAAHRGSLFLDEVAELPLELQAKLLRVLETRTVIPVGGIDAVAVDARIIAATHQPLRAAVAHGRFRADLMYRLRIVPVFLPALAARKGDVELLAGKLIDQLNAHGGRRVTRIAPAALEAMRDYPWPGNVRELRSALEYAYVIGDGPVLVEADLPPEINGVANAMIAATPAVTALPDDAPEPAEARRIRGALERAAGNRERAAQILGISRVTLWRRMRTFGLLAPDEGSAISE